MPCFFDGQLSCCQSSTVRKVLTDSTVLGVPKTISIDWMATFEAQLEQLTMSWQTVPTTNEAVDLSKISVISISYDTILRDIDPADELIEDWVLLAPFRWRVGDHVKLDYPNSDNLRIGAEIILREV